MRFRSAYAVPAIIALCLAASALSGCAVVLGAGAAMGVAGVEERGLKGRATDLALQAKILDKFANEGLSTLTTISAEVYEGRVMLTGATSDTALADKALALTYQVDGVQEVFNEIQYNAGSSVSDYTHDVWITTQISTALTFDKEILSVNYDVQTINGVVYLMGIAQNQAELDKVIAHCTATEYVRKVVQHVRIKQATSPSA